MKTLKIMSIIGIIWFGLHLLVANMPYYVLINGTETQSDFFRSVYGLAFSIVGLVQTNRLMKKHKEL
jgi:hypothetical protein